MLPLSYALRNLARNPGRFAQLVLGSGLVVLLLCLAAAFHSGMDQALIASGDPANVLVLGAGSEESVERSEIPAAVPTILAASIAGVAEDHGQAAVSGEVVYNGLVAVTEGGEPVQALLRGVTPAAIQVHRQVRVVEGRFPGPDEVMVGAGAALAMGVDPASLAVGSSIRIEDQDYRVAGRFVAPGGVLEAELWLPRAELMALSGRDTLSCAVIRLGSAEIADVEYFCATRLDLELVAIPETAYYAKLSAFFGPIKLMAWITAALVAAGALMGGLNTLYAAFAARIRELATLQAIGYRRWMIALSMLQESVLATTTGALLALAVGLVAVDGLSVAFASGVFALRFDPGVMLLGLLSGLVLGLAGCLPPLWRCLAPSLASTLRGIA
jgi:putative ABC transport system permease protein